MKRLFALMLALVLCAPGALAEYERVAASDKGPYSWGLKDGYWYFCNVDGDAFPGFRWPDGDFNWLNVDMLYYDDLAENRIALCFDDIPEGKWGLLDTYGNVVAEPQFDRLSGFANGNLLAVRDGKTGVIDPDGNVLIDFVYDSIHYYEGCALHKFETGGKWGFMDGDGNIAIEAQYDDASGMSGWAAVRTGDLWGMIAPDGSWIFEPQFDGYRSISDTYALVERNGKYGVAAPDGTMILDTVCDAITGFGGDGVSVVCLNGMWGYMGLDGQWTLEPRYEYAGNFGETGYAIVRTGGKYGMIGRDGAYLIEPVWDDIHDSAFCEVSQFETWEYTKEAYHAVDGGLVYYFDIADGAVIPPLP